MEGCDTLLMVGTSFPYSEFLPREGQTRAAQIDVDGKGMVGRFQQAQVKPHPGAAVRAYRASERSNWRRSRSRSRRSSRSRTPEPAPRKKTAIPCRASPSPQPRTVYTVQV